MISAVSLEIPQVAYRVTYGHLIQALGQVCWGCACLAHVREPFCTGTSQNAGVRSSDFKRLINWRSPGAFTGRAELQQEQGVDGGSQQ